MTKAEYARAWRKRNPEKHVINQMRYQKRNKEKFRVTRRRYHLKHTFGLSVEQYAEMFARQQGLCAVCRKPETGLRRGEVKSLDVDHNHQTNQIRDLLCSACNASLGLLKEDSLRIRALADYIERHNAK